MSSSLFWGEEPTSLLASPYHELQWLAERAGVSVETLCQTVEAATQFTRDSQYKSNFAISTFNGDFGNHDLEDVVRVLADDDDFSFKTKAVWIESQHPRDKDGKWTSGTGGEARQSHPSVSNTSKTPWRQMSTRKVDELLPVVPHHFSATGDPVSHGLQLDSHSQHLQRVIDAIGRVHGDGKLPRIMVNMVKKFREDSSTREYQGKFDYDDRTGAAEGIRIRSTGDAPELAALHEIAHFIDFKGIETEGSGTSTFSSKRMFLDESPQFSEEAFQELHAALVNSDSYKKLKEYENAKNVRISTPRSDGGGMTYKIDRKLAKYLASPEELFARAYCQYVATRSNDETLRKQIAATRLKGTTSIGGKTEDSLKYPEYWSPEDFESIGKAFDNLFQNQKWITPQKPHSHE